MNILYFNKENPGHKMSNPPPIRRPSTNQDMLALFTKSPSNQDTLLASGDRDCSRCCRLCGGDTSLKYFNDSYVWEGTEERYDQLLFDCFGIQVTPSNSMICEWCIRALRNTEKFRALVFTAFEQGCASDLATYVTTSDKTLRTNSCQTTSIGKGVCQPINHGKPKRKQFDSVKRRDPRKVWLQPEAKSKRVNVQCILCRQRYPMLVANGECKSFTCSRCKKKGEIKRAVCRKCNIAIPTHMVKEHMDLHAKADLRGKARPRQLKKLAAPIFAVQPKEKLPGVKCSKKYPLAKNMTSRARTTNGFSNDNITIIKKPCTEDARLKPEKQQADTEPRDSENTANECKLLFRNPPIRRPSTNQDMLALFTKSSSNQDTLLASGDRDCSQCCRLCGGDTSLKYFYDSYVWEGMEERYDQLLFDCFGIQVTPLNCMICEWCIRALRNTEKFRALVFAAYDQGCASDSATYVTTSDKILRMNSCQTTSIGKDACQPINHGKPKRKQYDSVKRRDARKVWLQPEVKNKRVNVQCILCRQRYPMLVANGECKSFTCSRCKKKRATKRAVCRKCNNVTPTHMVKEHMELHAKADLRGKARPRQPKKLAANWHRTACTEDARLKPEKQQANTEPRDSENTANEC